MTVMSVDAKDQLEAYLAGVVDVLRGDGHDLVDIQNVVESLREQIYDLATDGGHRPASLADIEQVLTEMEPPEAYRAVGRVLSIRSRQRSTKLVLAYLSVGLSIGAMLTIFAVPAMGWFAPYHPPVYGAGQVVALGAGLASWSEPLGRFGAICATLFLIAGLIAKA